jgi:hypothetical protein
LADEKSLQEWLDTIQVKLPEIKELCASKPFIGDIIQPIMKDFDESMNEIEEYSQVLRASLSSSNQAMDTIVTVTNEVETGVDTAQKWFIVCVWISTLFFVVVVAMLVCTAFVANDTYNCFTKTITTIGWPLFSILLFLVWVFSSLFLATSLSGSDICVSPDEVVFAALNDGFRDTQGAERAVYLNLVNYVMVRT